MPCEVKGSFSGSEEGGIFVGPLSCLHPLCAETLTAGLC